MTPLFVIDTQGDKKTFLFFPISMFAFLGKFNFEGVRDKLFHFCRIDSLRCCLVYPLSYHFSFQMKNLTPQVQRIVVSLLL